MRVCRGGLDKISETNKTYIHQISQKNNLRGKKHFLEKNICGESHTSSLLPFRRWEKGRVLNIPSSSSLSQTPPPPPPPLPIVASAKKCKFGIWAPYLIATYSRYCANKSSSSKKGQNFGCFRIEAAFLSNLKLKEKMRNDWITVELESKRT